MPGKEGIQPRQQSSTRARQALRNSRGRTVNQLQQFAAAQRTQHINFLARQKTFHIKRARIQIIPRRPRLHQHLDAISRPQTRRRFRNSRPWIKIHAQPAARAQRRALGFHPLQINLKPLPPRQCQRIFAQTPAPAQGNARIHAPGCNQSGNMIRRNRRAFNTSSQSANRDPREKRASPRHRNPMPPRKKSRRQNSAHENSWRRPHRPQPHRPRPSRRNPDARRKRAQNPQRR
jgi:hypothetical protein